MPGRKRNLGRRCLVAALMVATLRQPARADVLCRKRSGQLVVAAQCGRKDTPVAPADVGVIGPPGSPGTAGTPGDPGVLPFRVVDANGQAVGVVQGQIADRTQVVLSGAALTVPIQIEVIDGQIASFSPPSSDSVFYDAADCTGPPFIRFGGGPLPRGQLIGDVLYYATAAQVMRSYGSREQVEASCGGTPTPRGTCCRVESSTTFSSTATAVALTALGIALPLALEARP
jgi:hypothetical protein